MNSLHAAAHLSHVVPAKDEGGLDLAGDLHSLSALLGGERGLLEERVLDLALVSLASKVTLLLLEVSVAKVLAALASECLVLLADLAGTSVQGEVQEIPARILEGVEGEGSRTWLMASKNMLPNTSIDSAMT